MSKVHEAFEVKLMAMHVTDDRALHHSFISRFLGWPNTWSTHFCNHGQFSAGKMVLVTVIDVPTYVQAE
jgi:hypothetical protein